MPQRPVLLKRFANDCLEVQLQANCRERDVFIIQPLVPSVQEHLAEPLPGADAARGASAARVTAVMSHYAYARSDKEDEPRISIGGRLVADLLVTAGVNRVLTPTLHSPQVHGFFPVPVDHLHALRELAAHFRGRDLSRAVVVSPDLGYAKSLRASHQTSSAVTRTPPARASCASMTASSTTRRRPPSSSSQCITVSTVRSFTMPMSSVTTYRTPGRAGRSPGSVVHAARSAREASRSSLVVHLFRWRCSYSESVSPFSRKIARSSADSHGSGPGRLKNRQWRDVCAVSRRLYDQCSRIAAVRDHDGAAVGDLPPVRPRAV